jgi:hypothetical protein
MSITATSNWYPANYQYLMTSIDRICIALEHYIARKKNQPISAEPTWNQPFKPPPLT